MDCPKIFENNNKSKFIIKIIYIIQTMYRNINIVHTMNETNG